MKKEMNMDYIHVIEDLDSKSTASREFVQYYKDMCKAFEDSELGLEGGRRIFSKWGDYGSEPGKVDYVEVDADGVSCMWLIPKESIDDRVIICCHGGGYTYGSMFSHRKAYAHQVKEAGCIGILVNYRNTPEYDWPAPLEDVVTVYQWLLEKGYKPEHIAITGDSCGGALSLSVPLTLKERNLPMLAASMPICPWCDLMATTPIYDYNEKDVLNSKGLVQGCGIILKDAGHDITDPHLAPMYLSVEDMKGFPPTYIQVGGCENFVDEAKVVAATAKEAGVDIRLDIVGAMQHSFNQIAGGCMDADRALQRYANWLRPILDME